MTLRDLWQGWLDPADQQSQGRAMERASLGLVTRESALVACNGWKCRNDHAPMAGLERLSRALLKRWTRLTTGVLKVDHL
jgi:hypothetical protein